MNQVGLPPAILKHAGGMFHLIIIEGRVGFGRSFDTGPRQAQSLLRMSDVGSRLSGKSYAS